MCPACDMEVQEVNPSEPVAEPRRLPWLARLKHLLGEVGYMDDAYTTRRRGVGRPPSRTSRCGASRRSGSGWTGARSSAGSSASPVSYSSTCSPGAERSGSVPSQCFNPRPARRPGAPAVGGAVLLVTLRFQILA